MSDTKGPTPADNLATAVHCFLRWSGLSEARRADLVSKGYNGIADLQEALSDYRAAEASAVVAGARCEITGNLCGTDTWALGSPCKCAGCQKWLSEQPSDFRPTQPPPPPAAGNPPKVVASTNATGGWDYHPGASQPAASEKEQPTPAPSGPAPLIGWEIDTRNPKSPLELPGDLTKGLFPEQPPAKVEVPKLRLTMEKVELRRATVRYARDDEGRELMILIFGDEGYAALRGEASK